MDREVVHQIGQQQVEGKERRSQKEIVHRMQLDTPNRAQNEHHKEKEEQRNRRKETDLPGQRSWLQLVRHLHPNLKP